MTIRKLRTIDLMIFFAIGSLLDVILGMNGFFGIRSYLAISIPLLLLLYIRWGKYAIFPNVGIALIHLFLYDTDFVVRLCNSLSLLVLVSVLLFMRLRPFQKIKIEFRYVTLLYITVYLLMFFAECLFLIIFGKDPLFASRALNHLINFFLGIGLLALIAAQKELLVRMDPYLREKSKESQKNEEE